MNMRSSGQEKIHEFMPCGTDALKTAKHAAAAIVLLSTNKNSEGSPAPVWIGDAALL